MNKSRVFRAKLLPGVEAETDFNFAKCTKFGFSCLDAFSVLQIRRSNSDNTGVFSIRKKKNLLNTLFIKTSNFGKSLKLPINSICGISPVCALLQDRAKTEKAKFTSANNPAGTKRQNDINLPSVLC